MGDAISGLFGDAYGKDEGDRSETPAATHPEPDTDELEPTFPAEPEPAAQPAAAEPQPEPEPAAAEPPPKMVPISALEALRRENQALKRERYVPPPEPVARPSVYDDPDAFEQDFDQRFTATEMNLRFTMSERFAVREHGEQTVKEAQAWAVSQDQATRQAILQSADPVGETISRFQRDKLLSEVAPDPDAYVRRRAAELGLIGQGSPTPAPAAVSPQPSPSVAPPRRSIASVPGAAATVADAPGSAFEGVKFNLDR